MSSILKHLCTSVRSIVLFALAACLIQVPVATTAEAAEAAEPVGSAADEEFIVGLRGATGILPQIAIYSSSGATPALKWLWTRPDPAPAGLECIASGTNVTEVKLADHGRKILAIVGGGVVVISRESKKITYGTCDGVPGNAHSAEMLPDGFLAVADTASSSATGVTVYDTKQGNSKPPVQKLKGTAFSHGVQWDARRNYLWAIGSNKYPSAANSPVRMLLNRYTFNPDARKNNQPPFTNPDAPKEFYPYGSTPSPSLAEICYPNWVDNPHDLAPGPGSDTLLIATSLTVFQYDIGKNQFSQAKDLYFDNFTSRYDETAKPECNYPQNPLQMMKSISMSDSGKIAYAQTKTYDFTDRVGFVANGANGSDFDPPEGGKWIYKVRWFQDRRDWPTAPEFYPQTASFALPYETSEQGQEAEDNVMGVYSYPYGPQESGEINRTGRISWYESPGSSGTVNFSARALKPGQYRAVYFKGYSDWHWLSQPSRFFVSGLSFSKATYQVGEKISVDYASKTTPEAGNWIRIYTTSNPANYSAYACGGTVKHAFGTLTMSTCNLAAGTYYAYYGYGSTILPGTEGVTFKIAS